MEGMLQVPQDFWRTLVRPPILSPIHVQYRSCLFVGWPGRKRWLRWLRCLLTKCREECGGSKGLYGPWTKSPMGLSIKS